MTQFWSPEITSGRVLAARDSGPGESATAAVGPDKITTTVARGVDTMPARRIRRWTQVLETGRMRDMGGFTSCTTRDAAGGAIAGETVGPPPGTAGTTPRNLGRSSSSLVGGGRLSMRCQRINDAAPE